MSHGIFSYTCRLRTPRNIFHAAAGLETRVTNELGVRFTAFTSREIRQQYCICHRSTSRERRQSLRQLHQPTAKRSAHLLKRSRGFRASAHLFDPRRPRMRRSPPVLASPAATCRSSTHRRCARRVNGFLATLQPYRSQFEIAQRQCEETGRRHDQSACCHGYGSLKSPQYVIDFCVPDTALRCR
jgi:hypothetical protein